MKLLGIKMMTNNHSRFSGLFVILFSLCAGLIAGCATLRPDFEMPSVSIISFIPLSSQGIAPRFEIGMRVVNPNSTQLILRGMSYKVALNNYEVVDGAANQLPDVPAYGEAEFKVVATVGLFESIRFVNDMLQNSRGQITYNLKTKLDVGAIVPAIRIEKTGSYTP